MLEYGIITTLPYSKYSSPIFSQRKPNGKLRFLVDLRRINHLLKNDYNQHNHPVTTMADAAQHMAGNRYFCKLACSQAYHCLQMADEQPVQLLASNLVSRTFAYLRLAQGLNRSVSAFNSTVRESTRWSRLISALNMPTTSALLPTMSWSTTLSQFSSRSDKLA